MSLQVPKKRNSSSLQKTTSRYDLSDDGSQALGQRLEQIISLTASLWLLTQISLTAAVADDLPVLRVGDQRGAIRVLLKGAGELEGTPYHLEWEIFSVGAPLVEAINANAVDFGYVGDATATFGLAANVPIKTINTWDFKGFGNAIVVPDAAPIKKVDDLRGKRIAVVRGSPGHLLVIAALRQAGIPMNDVKIVYLSAADAKLALVAGSIDAWAIWDPYIASAELHDHMRVLLSSEHVINEVECGVASDRAIATKRPQLLDFIARVRRAWLWANDHVEQFAQLYAKDTGIPYEVALKSWTRTHVVVADKITDEAIATHQNVADLYYDLSIIPAHIDISKAYDKSFTIDEKPLQEVIINSRSQ